MLAVALRDGGELCICDLPWIGERSQNLVSHHVRALRGEGVAGVAIGIVAGSIALQAFGISSAVEGLASVIVIWRFTGTRTLSETAEGRAQKLVAISFWLLVPYVVAEAVYKLVSAAERETSYLGIGLTVSSLVLMPLVGRMKHRLGSSLGSAATAGEGTQNILCAYLAVAVLVGFHLTGRVAQTP
jgi:divalent metal cation (Fe/Co/Zn/Cd) transporter